MMRVGSWRVAHEQREREGRCRVHVVFGRGMSALAQGTCQRQVDRRLGPEVSAVRSIAPCVTPLRV